jgi:hypothetical protein
MGADVRHVTKKPIKVARHEFPNGSSEVKVEAPGWSLWLSKVEAHDLHDRLGTVLRDMEGES